MLQIVISNIGNARIRQRETRGVRVALAFFVSYSSLFVYCATLHRPIFDHEHPAETIHKGACSFYPHRFHRECRET